MTVKVHRRLDYFTHVLMLGTSPKDVGIHHRKPLFTGFFIDLIHQHQNVAVPLVSVARKPVESLAHRIFFAFRVLSWATVCFLRRAKRFLFRVVEKRATKLFECSNKPCQEPQVLRTLLRDLGEKEICTFLLPSPRIVSVRDFLLKERFLQMSEKGPKFPSSPLRNHKPSIPKSWTIREALMARMDESTGLADFINIREKQSPPPLPDKHESPRRTVGFGVVARSLLAFAQLWRTLRILHKNLRLPTAFALSVVAHPTEK